MVVGESIIGDGGNVIFMLGMLVAAYLAYRIIEYYRPGYGQFPSEFSHALKWLDKNAESSRILAWWDYAAPLRDYTDTKPVLEGPSQDIRDTIDNPKKVRRWTDHEDVKRVASFFLSQEPDEALNHVPETEFDYVLVGRSDLIKVPAMAKAIGDPPEPEEPKDVMLRRLVMGNIDWPVAFESKQVMIYRTPKGEGEE
ncbi:MAG: hypothetical protein SV377_04010 [Halobacteria archaeon]|nr:hypothetical protein [Halobacteria archaeon]